MIECILWRLTQSEKAASLICFNFGSEPKLNEVSEFLDPENADSPIYWHCDTIVMVFMLDTDLRVS